MAQHDYVIDNQTGANFRTDLNNALQAIVTLNSGTSAPSTTYAYQLWYDTTNAVLKIRNAANSAWVTLGPLADSSQWGAYTSNIARLTIDSDGNVTCTATGAIKVPVGTTGQRPTAVQGQIRYNTSLNQFEGYNGTVWGAIGGASNANVDTFSGNASTTGFTLSYDPGSLNNTMVFISGVYQNKSTYTVSGTTLTFGSAPPAGTNNIQVWYGGTLAVGVTSDGSVTNAKLSNVATATFKGRTTAGTGSPEDLTATQATALLNAVVGDSGSGGTKGLVPAPASGDAAAGKYLKADGTWAAVSNLTRGTQQATTSGTAINFTGIPSGVKRIQIVLNGVSRSGSSPLLVQIGDSGGLETSGYTSSAGRASASETPANSAVGFVLDSGSGGAGAAFSGIVTLININSTTWISSGCIGEYSSGYAYASGGAKSLSDTLDRLTLRTVNGTDTFDAGAMNIFYE